MQAHAEFKEQQHQRTQKYHLFQALLRSALSHAFMACDIVFIRSLSPSIVECHLRQAQTNFMFLDALSEGTRSTAGEALVRHW